MLKVSLDRIFIILIYLPATSALLCLSCKHVYDVRDCFSLEECGAHQRCYSNNVVDSLGRSTYTLGCIDQYACGAHLESAIGRREANLTRSSATSSDPKRSASNTCLQCCNDVDGCNRKLCGTTTSNNLRCMTCRDAVETKHCKKFKECGRDQLCFVNRALNQISLERLYEMDCMGYQQCNGLKHASPQDCAICCNSTDYCNYGACNNWSATHTVATSSTSELTNTSPLTTSTSAITTSTSASTTTTPAITTTTPPPNLHILVSGPHVSSYGSRVEIKFIFMPHPQNYVWKLNGIQPLPKGVFIETSDGTLAGMATIVINELNESTSGTYTCIATMNGHEIEKTHYIEIQKERPTVHIAKPPHLTTSFALVCNATGYPLPFIQWDFIPESIGSHGIPPGVQIKNEALRSTLSVSHYIPVYHSGVWYCKAANSLGSALTSVFTA